jgi:3-oxoadipate CoA-transferase beta subunit
MSKGWSEDQLAARIARDIPEGACVNLGIGLPTKIPVHIPKDREVFFHSENGIIGMGPDPEPGKQDPDIVNAGKKHVTLIQGASIVHQADSFSLIRCGRLDAVVLGGLQVAANGDLANWKVPGTGVGGVGGAMDLVVGARKVLAMMRHLDKNGRSKLVKQCTFPLTGQKCVTTVYTDLGVFDCVDNTFVARELAPGVSMDEARASTDAPLKFT